MKNSDWQSPLYGAAFNLPPSPEAAPKHFFDDTRLVTAEPLLKGIDAEISFSPSDERIAALIKGRPVSSNTGFGQDFAAYVEWHRPFFERVVPRLLPFDSPGSPNRSAKLRSVSILGRWAALDLYDRECCWFRPYEIREFTDEGTHQSNYNLVLTGDDDMVLRHRTYLTFGDPDERASDLAETQALYEAEARVLNISHTREGILYTSFGTDGAFERILVQASQADPQARRDKDIMLVKELYRRQRIENAAPRNGNSSCDVEQLEFCL
jgi:hypothetical protein